MNDNFVKKAIIFGLIILLIGVSFVSNIGGYSEEINGKKINSFDKQFYHEDDIYFDRVINFLMKIGYSPSLSACIIKNNKVVWSKGCGLYDIEGGKNATEDTIYMICSVSKTVTGTALMQLYDRGLFDLDDDVNGRLSFSLRNPNFPDDPITYRMLLSHSSSILGDPVSYYWLNVSEDPPISGYPYPWLEEYLVPGGKYYIPEIWSEEYRPGERMQYANVNYDLVAYLVELISGQPFHEYCNENIFMPLCMTNTSFNLNELDIDTVASPYFYYNGKYEKREHYRLLHYPVGGMYTSVSDLSHFLIAHMNGGVYNGTRILEEETVEEMHRIQPPGNKDIYMNYGLAWMIITLLGKEMYSGHEGYIGGFYSCMLTRKSDETAIIYNVNGYRVLNNEFPATPAFLSIFVRLMIVKILFWKASIM